MDPELQGDQNEEYKPASDVNVDVNRAEPPELRDNSGKDLTDPNPADEEGVPGEDISQNKNQNYNRNTNQRNSQQLPTTQSGEPDKRFKQNQGQGQAVSGQS